MKKLAFVVAAASLFALAPIAERFGAVASSVALVWLAVLVAVSASTTFNAVAIASGALGALASGMLGSVSPAAAGAVLVAAAFAERTMRVRSKNARALHVGLALVAGALAGSLANAFAAAGVAVYGVAVVVGAVLAALPLLVEADDPVAHALDEAAALVSDPARASLREGAELRRTSEDVPLDRATQARVRSTWKALLGLAEARVRLEKRAPLARVRVAPPAAAVVAVAEGDAAPASKSAEPASKSAELAPATKSAADAVLDMLDQRIAEHVTVLARAFTAMDTAHAAAIGIDDAALAPVAQMGDSLEEVSRALVEVKSGASS